MSEYVVSRRNFEGRSFPVSGKVSERIEQTHETMGGYASSALEIAKRGLGKVIEALKPEWHQTETAESQPQTPLDGTYFAKKVEGGKDDSSNEKTQARQKAEAARIAAAAEERRQREAEDARLTAIQKIKQNADLQKQLDEAAGKKKKK